MKKFIGWARGKTPHGDETGIWHAVVESLEWKELAYTRSTRAACAESTRLAGQIESLPAGARVCQRVGCQGHRIAQGVTP